MIRIATIRPNLSNGLFGALLALLAGATLAACAGLPISGGVPSAQMAGAELAPTDPEVAGKEIVALGAAAEPSRTRSLAAAAIGPAVKDKEAAAPAVARTAENLFDVVTVLWGTDRRMPSAAGKPVVKGEPIVTGALAKPALPSSERGDRLSLGRAHVTIPRTARAKGHILRPRQVTFLNVSLYSEAEDPRRHFTIGDFEALDPAQFVRTASEHGGKGQRFKDQAVVFVHGYNTTFEHALYRTAQLAYDLEFDGVPYLYSWPSKGEESGYLYDRDSADRARTYFLQFLGKIAHETKAKKIHIIAHSMGTRPLLEALRTDHGRTARQLRIGEVILAAPDIDADVFRDIAMTIAGAAQGMTLYASANDRALKASKAIAGGKPRAGDVPASGPVVTPGIETVDITEAGPDSIMGLNHTTYAERSHVLSDMWLLLKEGVHPPDKRFAVFREISQPSGGTYWKYVKN